jgi:hypothetical protein
MMAVRFLRRIPRPMAKRQVTRGKGDLSAAVGAADVFTSDIEMASEERCVLTADSACPGADNHPSASSGDSAQSTEAVCVHRGIIGVVRRL